MKKLLATLLALCLLAVPMFGLAEAATAEMEMETYTHSTGSFSMQYPSDWTLMDRTTIDTLISLAANSSEEVKTIYSNVKSQLEVADIVMFLSPDMQCTANVNVQALGTAMTGEQISSLSKQLQSSIQLNLPTATFPDDGSVVTVGDNEYFMLEAVYTIAGTEFHAVNYLTAPNTNFYTINFTVATAAVDANMQAMGAMLASFVPAK